MTNRTPAPATEAEIEAWLQKCMDDELRRAIGGDSYTNATPPETTLDLRKALPEWEKMIRNARRSQVTFVVDQGHQGPPIQHETPNDGWRVELSWPDANRLHQEWPLRLHKTVSVDAAEYVPATTFDQFVPKVLPMPPYEAPEEESFEDWLSQDGTDAEPAPRDDK